MTTQVSPAPSAPSSAAGAPTRPRVWAPGAAAVDLHLPHPAADAGAVHPMTRADGGWWESPVDLPDGTDYAFAVDGGAPRPDPRSAWQPHGVHGPSRTFDASAFRWTDGSWPGRDVRGAVVYELHVGTYTDAGTLDAAIEHLNELVDLGVDVVELMPVAAFPGVHGWGYDGVALYAVHDPYGGPAALQRFVDAAHARGLAVCLDVVHNHLGPSGNYLGEFGPYFTDRHETPWGWAVNLDGPDAGEVRAFVLDNALRWLRDFHLDALRLDAVHALVDDSPRHLLAELADAVEDLAAEVGRPLSLVAESDLNDAAMVTPTAEGGLGMTAQWADDVHHAIHATVTGERHGYYVDFGSLDVLAQVMTRVFRHDGGFSTFRGRDWGRPVPDGVDARRFVVFSQDHDQVGNRALGDRPSEHVDAGGLAMSAALVLLSPFTPMLFMGEEWGARTRWQYFTDHAEPELAEAIRRGRTEEFSGHGWEQIYGGPVDVPDPQAASTVAASRLDRSERERPEHARMLRWYRDLVALRRSEPDVAAGDLGATRAASADDGSWFLLRRGAVAVVLALGEGPVTLDVAATEVLAAWDGAEVDAGAVTVPGRSVAVVRTGRPMAHAEPGTAAAAAAGRWTTPAHEALRAAPGRPVDLAAVDRNGTPGFVGGKKDGRGAMKDRGAVLSELQEKLYAHGRTGGDRSVLLVLQGMDTAGKGGVVRHVLGMVDPQGVALRAFGPPTPEEAEQHYLQRIRDALPAPGRIGVFDRSHYEDVLVVRVEELVPRAEWERRYDEIVAFEEEVVARGTTLVKVMLVVSYEEQGERLRERLERPDKHWKYNPGDIDARQRWDDYQAAYQAVLDRTSTDAAPWYVVPADRKWFARLAVTELLVEALEGLDLGWPRVDLDVAAELARLDATARRPRSAG